MADKKIKPLHLNPTTCGFLITRKHYETGSLKLYFIPHSDLKRFELDPKKAGVSEGTEILKHTPPAESHEVVLHGEFVTPHTPECAEKLKKGFTNDCCILEVDTLKRVLGIID